MSKFKVGDRVVVIDATGYPNDGVRVSDTGVVTDSEGRTSLVRVSLDQRPWRRYLWDVELFESSLALEASQSKDPALCPDHVLEALVRKANEGHEALIVLGRQYAGQVEYMAGGSRWTTVDPAAYSHTREVRIKPKAPPFEPFAVTSDNPDTVPWAVTLKDGQLSIGCKNFRAGEFLAAMLRVLSDANLACSDSMQGVALTPCRAGIRFKFPGNNGESHTLRWESAEAIVAALQKAGVK